MKQTPMAYEHFIHNRRPLNSRSKTLEGKVKGIIQRLMGIGLLPAPAVDTSLGLLRAPSPFVV